jgi:hypothetical protein
VKEVGGTPTSNQPYAEAWRRLRLHTLFACFAFIAWIPCIFLTLAVAKWLDSGLAGGRSFLEAITMFWWMAVAIALFRYVSYRRNFRCPRCGQAFFSGPFTPSGRGNPWVRHYRGGQKCGHCRLPKAGI